MSKKRETPAGRFKAVTLWQWGLLFIIAGLVANMVVGNFLPPPGNSAEARGQALGMVVACLLFVFAGVGMIIVHFVRRNRRK